MPRESQSLAVGRWRTFDKNKIMSKHYRPSRARRRFVLKMYGQQINTVIADKKMDARLQSLHRQSDRFQLKLVGCLRPFLGLFVSKDSIRIFRPFRFVCLRFLFSQKSRRSNRLTLFMLMSLFCFLDKLKTYQDGFRSCQF